jgi:hypothetical protein
VSVTPEEVTVKAVPLVAVPQAVVTEIVPEVAPEGTVAVICIELFTVKEADVPLNFTELTLTKPEPLMVTVLPTVPDKGVKLFITGNGFTVIVNIFDVAGLPVTHVALLVITQVIWLPFARELSE